jgi:hypothetical protein
MKTKNEAKIGDSLIAEAEASLKEIENNEQMQKLRAQLLQCQSRLAT